MTEIKDFMDLIKLCKLAWIGLRDNDCPRESGHNGCDQGMWTRACRMDTCPELIERVAARLMAAEMEKIRKMVNDWLDESLLVVGDMAKEAK